MTLSLGASKTKVGCPAATSARVVCTGAATSVGSCSAAVVKRWYRSAPAPHASVAPNCEKNCAVVGRGVLSPTLGGGNRSVLLASRGALADFAVEGLETSQAAVLEGPDLDDAVETCATEAATERGEGAGAIVGGAAALFVRLRRMFAKLQAAHCRTVAVLSSTL